MSDKQRFETARKHTARVSVGSFPLGRWRLGRRLGHAGTTGGGRPGRQALGGRAARMAPARIPRAVVCFKEHAPTWQRKGGLHLHMENSIRRDVWPRACTRAVASGFPGVLGQLAGQGCGRGHQLVLWGRLSQPVGVAHTHIYTVTLFSCATTLTPPRCSHSGRVFRAWLGPTSSVLRRRISVRPPGCRANLQSHCQVRQGKVCGEFSLILWNSKGKEGPGGASRAL